MLESDIRFRLHRTGNRTKHERQIFCYQCLFANAVYVAGKLKDDAEELAYRLQVYGFAHVGNLCVLVRAATAPVEGAMNALALQAASATHRMFRIGAMMLLVVRASWL